MFGNVTCVSPLGTLVSRVLFLVSAYLHIFCSFWINFSLLLFLIIMYCSCFLGPSSWCSEMCTLNPAIFVLHKLYNGISFSSCLGCLIQSCHVFLILCSTVLILRIVLLDTWYYAFIQSRINLRNICLSFFWCLFFKLCLYWLSSCMLISPFVYSSRLFVGSEV